MGCFPEEISDQWRSKAHPVLIRQTVCCNGFRIVLIQCVKYVSSSLEVPSEGSTPDVDKLHNRSLKYCFEHGVCFLVCLHSCEYCITVPIVSLQLGTGYKERMEKRHCSVQFCWFDEAVHKHESNLTTDYRVQGTRSYCCCWSPLLCTVSLWVLYALSVCSVSERRQGARHVFPIWAVLIWDIRAERGEHFCPDPVRQHGEEHSQAPAQKNHEPWQSNAAVTSPPTWKYSPAKKRPETWILQIFSIAHPKIRRQDPRGFWLLLAAFFSIQILRDILAAPIKWV